MIVESVEIEGGVQTIIEEIATQQTVIGIHILILP